MRLHSEKLEDWWLIEKMKCFLKSQRVIWGFPKNLKANNNDEVNRGGDMLEKLESVRFGKCQNLLGLESVRFGKCQNLLGLESARFGKCQNLRGLESVRFGKCQNLLGLESVRFGKCQNLLGLESVRLGKCQKLLVIQCIGSRNKGIKDTVITKIFLEPRHF